MKIFIVLASRSRSKAPGAASMPAISEARSATWSPPSAGPHVVAPQSNQKLNVVNSDSTTHNIHPMPANNRESNMIQPPGVPLDLTFAREEIAIPVKCDVHPWMPG